MAPVVLAVLALLLAWLVGIPLLTLLHELGHALTCTGYIGHPFRKSRILNRVECA